MTMAIPARQRWVFYAIVLVLTLTAVRWAGGQDRAEPGATVASQADRPERPARAAPAAAEGTTPVPEVRLDRLERRAAAAPAGDPFQARSWESKLVVARRSLPPPPPQAPPLPFAYLGKLIDGEQTTVFLATRDRNYVVRPGDTLDGRYRVEELEEDGVGLTYLPLGTRQTLPYAATPAPASAPPRTRGTATRPAADDEDEDE